MRPVEIDGLVTRGDDTAWAVTSPCGAYRYLLGRRWSEAGSNPCRFLDVCMLNPSKARHDVDDPTIRKLVHFGRQEGCAGLLVRNLAAYSATDPRELLATRDPVGPRNLEFLAAEYECGLRVAAWGNFPSPRVRRLLLRPRVQWTVSRELLHVFGLNGTGEPKHPLYLKNDTRVAVWT